MIYKREPKVPLVWLESKNTIIYRALVFFSFLALSGKWTLPLLLPLFDVLAQGLAIPNSLRLYSSFVESEEWSLGKRETVSKTGWKLWLCVCVCMEVRLSQGKSYLVEYFSLAAMTKNTDSVTALMVASGARKRSLFKNSIWINL